MTTLDLLNHMLNFAAPALAAAVLLALASRFLLARRARNHGLGFQVLVNAMAGLAALLGGLWLFGNDGKMASYAALVLACASSQWWLSRR
jgi:hypothetical protein